MSLGGMASQYVSVLAVGVTPMQVYRLRGCLEEPKCLIMRVRALLSAFDIPGAYFEHAMNQCTCFAMDVTGRPVDFSGYVCVYSQGTPVPSSRSTGALRAATTLFGRS